MSPFRILSPNFTLYTVLFTLACFCIWQAFGFIIVSKRETTSIASHIIQDDVIAQSGTKQLIDTSTPDESTGNTIPQLYCVDGDCSCKSMGCFECSKTEVSISALKKFCESENSFRKFECERGNVLKYGSCQNDNYIPFRPAEEARFLKFEVLCFLLASISYVVVWRRKKVGERVIVKRIQKLIEEPI